VLHHAVISQSPGAAARELNGNLEVAHSGKTVVSHGLLNRDLY
jgi:hypothetical protein